MPEITINLVHVPQHRDLKPWQVDRVLEAAWYVLNEQYIYVAEEQIPLSTPLRDTDSLAPEGGVQTCRFVPRAYRDYDNGEFFERAWDEERSDPLWR